MDLFETVSQSAVAQKVSGKVLRLERVLCNSGQFINWSEAIYHNPDFDLKARMVCQYLSKLFRVQLRQSDQSIRE